MNTSHAMAPCPRTTAQMEASRRNGAQSKGPVTADGKARSALNGTRHGLCSPRFFLLPDEDPQAFALFVVDLRTLLAPRDQAEHQAAERAAQAKWRAMRADRLEAEILDELFAAKALPNVAGSRTVRLAATKALSTMLRYRARVQRDLDRALAELAELQRCRRATEAARTSEPETVVHVAPESVIEAAGRPPQHRRCLRRDPRRIGSTASLTMVIGMSGGGLPPSGAGRWTGLPLDGAGTRA